MSERETPRVQELAERFIKEISDGWGEDVERSDIARCVELFCPIERENAALREALEAAYLTILSHPHDLWRTKNQSLYCALRDKIAEVTGQTEEDVQNHFEAIAAIGKKGAE